MAINVFPVKSAGAAKAKKIDYFTASGSWTAPSGVTFVIATMVAGGGGGGGHYSNGSAGTSTVFGSLTHEAASGGVGGNVSDPIYGQRNGGENTGQGGSARGERDSGSTNTIVTPGQSSTAKRIGLEVTPATSYTVTIGAGGAGGSDRSGNGASGYVTVEYEIEV